VLRLPVDSASLTMTLTFWDCNVPEMIVVAHVESSPKIVSLRSVQVLSPTVYFAFVLLIHEGDMYIVGFRSARACHAPPQSEQLCRMWFTPIVMTSSTSSTSHAEACTRSLPRR